MMISIPFEMGESPFIYRDSIVIPEGLLTPDEIEAEKQARYLAWLAIVNPPEETNNG